MTFTYRLARRLAHSRLRFAASVALAACSAGEATSPATSSLSNEVDAIKVTPKTATIETNQVIRFDGTGFNSAGDSMAISIEWTATGGSISADGVFSASTTGNFRVIGKGRGHNKAADTSTVVVVTPQPTLSSIVVSPDPATVAEGQTVAFSATGKLSDGSTTQIGVVWSATGGTIDAGGKYTAGMAPGTFRVVATNTSGTVADTVATTIAAPQLAQVVLSPGSTTTAVGGKTQFAAYGKTSLGDSVPISAVYSATGGAITPSGLYTAGLTAGSYRVIASVGAMADSSAVTVTTPPSPSAGLPVFPGAEGYGTTTPAGRGGQVIRVTNLNDAGPGSLRAAVAASGPRTVIFDVSGQINLQSSLFINNGFLTVAGQTAPSPGITIAIKGTTGVTNNGFWISASDVLIQHIRIRAETDVHNGARRDVLGIAGNRIVIDHVSASWATGAGNWGFGQVGSSSGKTMFTVGGEQDLTVSRSIIAEGIPYGFLISEDTHRLSIIRSLFASNANRNPQVKGGAHVLLLNNHVYNPGQGGSSSLTSFNHWNEDSGSPNATLGSLIGGTARAGPSSPSSNMACTFHSSLVAGSQFYRSDNSFSSVNDGGSQIGAPPFALPSPLTILSQAQVKAYVLANAGARPADRDAVDARIIGQTQGEVAGTTLWWNGKNETHVGGFPALQQNTRVLPVPGNHQDIRPSGYSVLEEDVIFPQSAAVGGSP